MSWCCGKGELVSQHHRLVFAHYNCVATFALGLLSECNGMDLRLNWVWMPDVRGAKTSMHPSWQPARIQSSGITARAVIGP